MASSSSSLSLDLPALDERFRDTLSPEQLECIDTLKTYGLECIRDDETIVSDEERVYLSSVWLSDRCARRYAEARQWKMDASQKMLRDSISYYGLARPHRIDPREPSIESSIRMGHMYSRVYDRQRRPACVLRVHTERDPHTNDEKLRFMVYSMMKAIDTMDDDVEKMVWLVSCTGYNLKHNGDTTFARMLLSVLSDQMPERLHRVFIFDAPFVFRMMWKCISPFCDDKTRNKFVFVGNQEASRVMEEHFDLADLETVFGGTSAYEFSADEYMEECDHVFQSKNNDKQKKKKKKKKKKKSSSSSND
jgi:phosphatidylinositol/phosphatidylcholine transfer protein